MKYQAAPKALRIAICMSAEIPLSMARQALDLPLLCPAVLGAWSAANSVPHLNDVALRHFRTSNARRHIADGPISQFTHSLCYEYTECKRQELHVTHTHCLGQQ